MDKKLNKHAAAKRIYGWNANEQINISLAAGPEGQLL